VCVCVYTCVCACVSERERERERECAREWSVNLHLKTHELKVSLYTHTYTRACPCALERKGGRRRGGVRDVHVYDITQIEIQSS